MLELIIPETEQWDDINQVFIYIKPQTLRLEHSLVSVSKWEARWNKPFLSNANVTVEETLDYIKCMTITQNVKPEVYYALTNEHIEQINQYISAPMTATTINEDNTLKKHSEIITSELIYYWMIALNIPMECQKWHLNRLLMLIRVCNIKNQPPKKMSQKEVMDRYARINRERRQKRLKGAT